MNHGSEAEDGEKITSNLSKTGKGTRPPAKAARQSAAAGGDQRAARVERAAPGRPWAGTRQYGARATQSAGIGRDRAGCMAQAASYPVAYRGCVWRDVLCEPSRARTTEWRGHRPCRGAMRPPTCARHPGDSWERRVMRPQGLPCAQGSTTSWYRARAQCMGRGMPTVFWGEVHACEKKFA